MLHENPYIICIIRMRIFNKRFLLLSFSIKKCKIEDICMFFKGATDEKYVVRHDKLMPRLRLSGNNDFLIGFFKTARIPSQTTDFNNVHIDTGSINMKIYTKHCYLGAFIFHNP